MFKVGCDILPCQASAVPCERVFSSSKETCALRRNQLSNTALERLQILKYIFKLERLTSTTGLVATEQELVDAQDREEGLNELDSPILDSLDSASSLPSPGLSASDFFDVMG